MCCALVERFWFLLSGRSTSDGITGHRRAWVEKDSFFVFFSYKSESDRQFFYVEMDFGSSPPLWTFDPRLVSRREVGFDGIGPGFD